MAGRTYPAFAWHMLAPAWEYEFAGQLMQAPAPVSENVPGEHWVQAVPLTENVPAAHGVHEDAPKAEIEPDRHVVQALTPAVAEYFPASHWVQAAPPAENVPAAHWVHEDAPKAEPEPDGHDTISMLVVTLELYL